MQKDCLAQNFQNKNKINKQRIYETFKVLKISLNVPQDSKLKDKLHRILNVYFPYGLAQILSEKNSSFFAFFLSLLLHVLF